MKTKSILFVWFISYWPVAYCNENNDPVVVGGGYRFVFTNTGQTQGDRYVFPEKWGNDSQKGIFAIEMLRAKEGVSSYLKFKIKLSDSEHRYL